MLVSCIIYYVLCPKFIINYKQVEDFNYFLAFYKSTNYFRSLAFAENWLPDTSSGHTGDFTGLNPAAPQPSFCEPLLPWSAPRSFLNHLPHEACGMHKGKAKTYAKLVFPRRSPTALLYRHQVE
jgi:hypothetical protein